MATHLTRFIYNAAKTQCRIEHAVKRKSPSQPASDAENARHEHIVQSAKPKRPGQWELVESGGTSSTFINHRGYIPTYYAYWAINP